MIFGFRFFRATLACSLLPLLGLSACHPTHTIDIDVSVPPRVAPTTELEYLIAQNQLPPSLRSIETDPLVYITVTPEGKTWKTITNERNLQITNVPQPPSTQIPAAPPLLMINPRLCGASIRNDPFIGTKAAVSWNVEGTRYSSTVTTQKNPLTVIQNLFTRCSHVQIDTWETKFTLDSTVDTKTNNPPEVLHIETTTVIVNKKDGVEQNTMTFVFSQRYFTIIKGIAVQILAVRNAPFDKYDNSKLQTLLSRQIANITD